MSKPLLINEYERKYYDVDIEYQLVATVTKRIYIDEMAQKINIYYECEEWEHDIIWKKVGEDEHHHNNQNFAEYIAPDEIENEDINNEWEISKTFVTGSTKGSEQWGDEVWQCVICKEHFTGYGNNPDPLAHGKGECCDVCNTNQVIPARIKMMVA